ncbi:diaminopimelate epimerase [Paenibacillus sp. P96]|uniref:Diaminopimelate epimerase n=1 Tax=Paenibacillus zeirhizosphaerae TaxID=2987519 RepID=A0ABT9FTX6_9BACL|nr:diaminopimelate epimerase [Paenibacillus sp. P96]MDP4098194.1 diaminopimelate epimerase [Paenibacillus sp. P96]
MSQVIEFVKCNPTQNMTILVKTSHATEEYIHIASKIMSYDNVYGEQVGFIEKSYNNGVDASLKMAGGEFCGNACMALAAFVAAERGVQHLDITEVVLEASGTEQFVRCQVKRNGDEYDCELGMPLPKQIERKTIQYEGSDLEMVIVRYEDFIHIVLKVDDFDEAVKRKAQTLAKLLGVTLGSKLIGILLYKRKSAEMAPLIYVPHLDSMVWERGCGSGTASLGACLAWENKREFSMPIKQPGGIINVAAYFNGEKLTDLKIAGTVGIVAQGQAFI